MKKLFSLLLTAVMMLTIVPFSALALEEKRSEDTLVKKAIVVFPEYSEKILTPETTRSVYMNNDKGRELVVTKTRPLSDNEYITYSEYSDGLILLSGYDYSYDTTVTGSSSGPGYKDITINIEAACVSSYGTGYFYLNGVSYRLNDGWNNYDTIRSEGSPSKGSLCSGYERQNFVSSESAEGYARIQYRLTFRVGPNAPQFVTSYLTLHVGEDTAVVEHWEG